MVYPRIGSKIEYLTNDRDKTDIQNLAFGQVIQIMKTEFVNVYQECGLPRGNAGAGFVSAWIPDVPKTVSGSRKRPAVLILPGGGYSHTSEREAEPVALRLVARGYAAFVLHYSCAPSSFPVPLREAALAMRFIRENSQRFSVDASMVAAMGFSAGGHLCGTLGTMYDCPEVADIGPAQLLRPDVLGLCYPVAVSWGETHRESFENISAGDPELKKRLSLDRLVRSDMPPVFLWHTRNDSSVPCRNSLLLAAALEANGVDFAMHIYRRGQHGLSTADENVYPVGGVPKISRDVPGWLDAAINFFEETGLRITDLEA